MVVFPHLQAGTLPLPQLEMKPENGVYVRMFTFPAVPTFHTRCLGEDNGWHHLKKKVDSNRNIQCFNLTNQKRGIPCTHVHTGPKNRHGQGTKLSYISKEAPFTNHQFYEFMLESQGVDDKSRNDACQKYLLYIYIYIISYSMFQKNTVNTYLLGIFL